MTNQGVTRRDMIKWSAASALLTGGPQLSRLNQIPIGVQLYSVRDECAKDFDSALKQVAAMGFEGVEFAGYYRYKDDAAGLKTKLDELGLKAAGTHIGPGAFEGDNLKRTIAFHKTIGCTFLIVPGESRFTDPEKSKEYADVMNQAAQALKKEGIFCGHHNHTGEFKRAEGKTYWELFGERTSQDVIFQMDIGWVRAAGLDPVELIKKFPGRIKTTHVKAKPPAGRGKAYVGQDDFDWNRVLSACSGIGGTEWFLIEQEEYPEGKTPMECTKISLDGLKAILKR